MPNLSPIQPAFHAGEVTPRRRGRVDLDDFKFGLSFCENFKVLPHGSLLMRAGTKDCGLEANSKRVIPFYTAGGDAYSIVLKNNELRVYDSDGALVTHAAAVNLNGFFDAGLNATGAVQWGGGGTWNVGGFVHVGAGAAVNSNSVGTVIGRSYTVKFRIRATTAAGNMQLQNVFIDDLVEVIALTPQWATYSFTFVSTHANDGLQFFANGGVAFDFDDVVFIDNSAAATEALVAPWATAQIAAVQFDQDLTKNRMMLVHPNVAPRVLTRSVHGTWHLYEAPFISPPTAWGNTNYPACIDWGFQGRLWLGGAPDEPNVYLGSKAGYPFDFTMGGTNPDDPVSYNASIRGPLRWLQGQKMLLMGSEMVEQSASGGDSVISPATPPLHEDESAFGSAALQAAHVGDEVLFVSRDRKSIRAMSYDAQTKNGWIVRAISFVAEHLFRSSTVKEIHFIRNPDSIIFAVFEDGTLRAVTFDRSEKIIAWWRVSGDVVSAAATEGTNGGSLTLIMNREDGTHIELLPMHETSIDYLDSWSEETVAGGEVSGLGRFEGEDVSVKVDGVLAFEGLTVAAGVISGLDDYEGEDVVVGLPFEATATTLPVEGGNPEGTSQGHAVHWAEIVVRLNDSARPLINGERASTGKPYGTAVDTLETLLTTDVRVGGAHVEEGGAITIKQDKPYRTEVCAIFGRAAVSTM